MMQYINRYFGAYNPDKNEVAISFFQESPVLNLTPDSEPGLHKVSLQNVSIEPVANLVMNRDCAHNLMGMLKELLEGPLTEEKE